MKVGLIGLPQSGKSTVFQALTSKKQDFSKDFDIAEVEVPDENLRFLADSFSAEKITPIKITFVDIKISTREVQEGINAKNIKDVDEICFVIRLFENETVPHPFSSVDPLRDLELLNTAILLSDMELSQKRIQKIHDELKKGIKKNEKELELLEKIYKNLEKELPVRDLQLNEQEKKVISGYKFLSEKPILVILNIDEENLNHKDVNLNLDEMFKDQGYKIVKFCAELEKELSELEEPEKKEYMESWGIDMLIKDIFIQSSYENLDLITFYTVKGKETKAWSIKKGTAAWEAAGKIHSDIQRGFIRAEVLNFKDFKTCKSFESAKEKGFIRLEGKDYLIQDADIINFKFNV